MGAGHLTEPSVLQLPSTIYLTSLFPYFYLVFVDPCLAAVDGAMNIRIPSSSLKRLILISKPISFAYSFFFLLNLEV